MDASSRYHVDTRRGACHRGGEPAAGVADTVASRTNRDGGFALPIVIFALVLLGVIGVAALQASRDELLSATAVSGSNQAFYAAEAGIHSAVSNSDMEAMDTLVAIPGDSLVGSWTTIENRCSYRLVYRRIDGGDANTKLYSIGSTGQSPGLNGGRRRVGIIVKSVKVPPTAIVFGPNLEISGSATIVGDCGGVHTNGDTLLISGNPTISDGLTTSGVAAGTGSPVDTLGNPVTATGGEPAMPIPDLDSTDYCGEADFIFNSSGLGLKVSTSETFDFSGATQQWGWEWDSAKNLYITKSTNIDDGVYCIDGNVQFPNDVGSPGNPETVTILATGSVQISGNPYLRAAHSDSILIIAEGDLDVSGNPSGGFDTFEGLVYGGAQCSVSGNPSFYGQLVCSGDPNPSGSEEWVEENKISGSMTLRYMCGGPLVDLANAWEAVFPIAGRMWNHVW